MKNLKSHLLLAVLTAVVFATFEASSPAQEPQGSAPASLDALRQSFLHPPDNARPMVRWWWFGPAVTNAELERELRTMKQGGFGGVEVQPVYPLAMDDPAAGQRNVPYLSDDFLQSLRFVADKTRELGLRMDLTLGSGWPYGGPQVPVSEAAGALRIARLKVPAGTSRVALPNIVEGERLIAVFEAPASAAQRPEDFKEITTIEERVVRLSPEQRARELLVFISSRTGQQVKRAAVGAEGFVVDHYDPAAVEHYLHSVGDRLMQAFDDNRPYAVFCDSLEVYGSDWTPDFLQEFQKRRGYDLRPYLPALAADIGPKSNEIRYDRGRTLTELFDERFAARLHAWAKQNHTLLRMQAYGMPPAELSSGALVDLPEGEGAQWKSLSATRWASSASHIFGVPVTSSETWTWLHSPVFRASPLDMKAEADRHFLEGINQLIGHGWPYTAPGVPYPGWRFYASAVFDEKNPWWIAMPDVTAYLQRVSYLLRQGSPANDVAIYLPTSDAYTEFRPGSVNLYQMLSHRVDDVVERVLDAGYGVDFFDDDALRSAGRIEGNAFALGPNRYRIVVLPKVQRIPLDTYRKLQDFVNAGGIVVATGCVPEIAPGLRAIDADNAEVRGISQRLFEASGAPAHFVKDEAQLGGELNTLFGPEVTFSPAAPDIGFLHRHAGDAEIYFVANTGNTRKQVTATFRVKNLGAETWNAMTGATSAADVQNSSQAGTTVALDLAPYESRVIVFSPRTGALRAGATAAKPRAAFAAALDLSSGWKVTFSSTGITEQMDHLRSWTDDERTRYFSGTATYERTFSFAAPKGNQRMVLNLGDGTPVTPQPLKSGMQAWLDAPVREAAVIYVNDHRAGSIWCAPYEIDVTPWLKAGENRLRIEVANLALNHMAGHALPDYRLLNLRYGVRFEAQDMDKVQPIPSGLFGPIRLMTQQP